MAARMQLPPRHAYNMIVVVIAVVAGFLTRSSLVMATLIVVLCQQRLLNVTLRICQRP